MIGHPSAAEAVFRENNMRDLNPLYSAVLQAVEQMAPAGQAPTLKDIAPDGHATQTRHSTESQSRLHRLLNGDFKPTTETADEDSIAEPAHERH
ncbi:hypothetical protein ALP36_01102 [Pseudomonas syringae pv. coriandricola]|uniref:Uncharacterized protein n=2 Tax=Pseudomonas syringae group genomosp. 3 TaxID=251701 RepID=A0A3M5R4A6_9PSED|nr:hypothetical protein ALP87_02091 [Pseudomonas syringae pv. coriandricola]RMU03307.1 hypothetical protein ALP36_01102 [Pseudomonas syringae pv. coriandricola]